MADNALATDPRRALVATLRAILYPRLIAECWQRYPRIRAYIAGLVSHATEDDIEDIAQAALVAAFHACATYHGQSQLMSWLFGIARHKTYDELRRRYRDQCMRTRLAQSIEHSTWRRRRPRLDIHSDERREGAASERIWSPPWPRALELQIEANDLADLIAQVLARLPAHYAEMIELHYRQGLLVPEIAALKGGAHLKKIESLITRARRRFRAELEALLATRQPQRPRPGPDGEHPAQEI